MNQRKRDLKDDVYTKLGENFGASINGIFNPMRTRSVTIQSVDVEANLAMVTVYEGDEPMSVPMTLLGIPEGMFRVIPKVGSLALIGNSNSNENAPFFIAYSEIDEMRFKSGTAMMDFRTKETKRFRITNENVGVEVDAISKGDATFAVQITKETPEDWDKDVGELSALLGLQTNTIASMVYDNGIQLHLAAKDDTLSEGMSLAITETAAGLSSLSNSDLFLFLNNGDNTVNFCGSDSGLVLLNKLTEKLNALVDAFNNHKHNIPASTFLVSATGGVPNPAPVPTVTPITPAQKFVAKDYENTMVKQNES